MVVLGVLAFLGVFHWAYLKWLHPTFGYLGFGYETPLLGDQILASILSVLPALWLPLHIRRPSHLISWVLYLAIFIPSMFVPIFVQLQDLESIRMLMLVMFTGFFIVCLPHQLPLLTLPNFVLPRTTFWAGYWVVLVGLIGWVVVVFHGHFRLVGFRDIYESVRFSAQEVSNGTAVGYAGTWLSGSLIPLLMSWSLLKRRPMAFMFGVLVLLMLYSTAGLKSVLLSALITPAFYILMSGKRISFASKLIWLTVALIAGLTIANLVVEELSGFHLMLSAIVILRTFGGPGLLTAMYHDFFTNHPLTYYSQVKGINLIVRYPYEHGIGTELGYYYAGRADLNSNAHLWCTDGIASFGLPGILLISVLCALVFWLLDSASVGHKPTFAATAVSFAALNLSNVSLFTTLLSGGLFFSILILYLMPREPEELDMATVEEIDGSDFEQTHSETVPELLPVILDLKQVQESNGTTT